MRPTVEVLGMAEIGLEGRESSEGEGGGGIPLLSDIPAIFLVVGVYFENVSFSSLLGGGDLFRVTNFLGSFGSAATILARLGDGFLGFLDVECDSGAFFSLLFAVDVSDIFCWEVLGDWGFPSDWIEPRFFGLALFPESESRSCDCPELGDDVARSKCSDAFCPHLVTVIWGSVFLLDMDSLSES